MKLDLKRNVWTLTKVNSRKTIKFKSSFHKLAIGSSDFSCSRINISKYNLVAPNYSERPKNLLIENETGFTINFDFPGLIFWCLTRAEEVGRADVYDEHGRFPAKASHALKHDYLDRPIVDEWFLLINELSEKLWGIGKNKQNVPSMELSHDVDDPTRYGGDDFINFFKRFAKDVLIKREFDKLWKAPISRLKAKKELSVYDPYNTFNWLMEQSEKVGVASTFYFITRPDIAGRDIRYNFEAKSIGKLMQNIHARGHWIGLHPSYGSFNNEGKIVEEANALRQACLRLGIKQETYGARMHYLQWRAQHTSNALAQAGMIHDSTVGYADMPGFRASTCFKYPAFDIIRDSETNIVIHPLIVMEVSVMAEKYLGLGDAKSIIEKIEFYKTRCSQVGGTFSLLWHNSVFTERRDREIYKAVIS